MLLVDGHGTPLSVLAASASLGETSLLEPLLDQSLSPTEPARLIYDRALDSDIHRERLRERGIELVCPHRKNRTRAKEAGWPGSPTLRATLEDRTHQQLAT